MNQTESALTRDFNLKSRPRHHGEPIWLRDEDVGRLVVWRVGNGPTWLVCECEKFRARAARGVAGTCAHVQKAAAILARAEAEQSGTSHGAPDETEG